MKILFYIHNLQIGGAEKIVADYLVHLKNSEIDVALVVNNKVNSYLENEVTKNDIRIYELYKTSTNNGHFIFQRLLNRIKNIKLKFNRIVEFEKPDIIHIHTLIYKIYGIKFPVHRMVFTFHSDPERFLKTNPKKNSIALNKMSKKGLNFFALTNYMKDKIISIFSTKNVCVIPNGIDIERIKKSRYNREWLFVNYYIAKDAFVIMHIGRFDKVKNHERLLSIFAEIHKRNSNSYLLLIGGDANNRMEIIKNEAKKRGIANNILFLGIRQDATSILGCANCLILPSLSESFSLVSLEAQALGIRSIVSDNVPSEVLCNSNCFSLSLFNGDDKWAELALSNSTGPNNKDLSCFDLKNVTKKLINMYERIIKGEY
ncbi:MAG: glycosyltransferase [Bacilli bacterium]|jgi:glycosyltransferase involved in cell wall biosynthesis